MLGLVGAWFEQAAQTPINIAIPSPQLAVKYPSKGRFRLKMRLQFVIAMPNRCQGRYFDSGARCERVLPRVGEL
jgi:hypothetical protein